MCQKILIIHSKTLNPLRLSQIDGTKSINYSNVNKFEPKVIKSKSNLHT